MSPNYEAGKKAFEEGEPYIPPRGLRADMLEDWCDGWIGEALASGLTMAELEAHLDRHL